MLSSSDYRYVTPSTVSDSNTGETGSAQRNAAHMSDLCRYERQPKYGGDGAGDKRHRGDDQHPAADGSRRDRDGNPGQPQDVADHQSADAGDPDRSQKLIMWPTRPWKHSCSASDIVGWV